MNSSRYWVWNAVGVDMQSLLIRVWLGTAASQGVRGGERAGCPWCNGAAASPRGASIGRVVRCVALGPCGVSGADRCGLSDVGWAKARQRRAHAFLLGPTSGHAAFAALPPLRCP